MLLPSGGDVADPIGQTVGAYRQCAEQITEAVKHHAERLRQDLCAAGRLK